MLGPDLFTSVDQYPQEEFDIIEEAISTEDRERFAVKEAPGTGSYVLKPGKFDQTKQFAKLYRRDGNLALVPYSQAGMYLRQRSPDDGERVFFSKPPREAPKAASDPCPVDVMGTPCGRRMLNQFELIKHMMRKHSDIAPFYLNQKQIDAAKGIVAFNPGVGIPEIPVTPPEEVKNTGGISIDTSELK